MTVREVMVPRPDIFPFRRPSVSEALGRVVEEQHSRVPVYDPQRGPEHIIGVLYAKDLMRWTRLRLTSTPDQPVVARVSAMRMSHFIGDVLVMGETEGRDRVAGRFQRTQAAYWRWWWMSSVATAGVDHRGSVVGQMVGEIEDGLMWRRKNERW